MTAPRISALHGHYSPGRIGAASDGDAGVTLREVSDLSLHQIAAWHDTLHEVGAIAARAIGVTNAPPPGKAIVGENQTALLRVEPLKWWLIGEKNLPTLTTAQGTTLDLSHSRTRIHLTGKHATTLLNRHLPLDLRPKSFPESSVATSVFHHTAVTIWRNQDGYELFLPRGFALSLWEVLLQTAEQFNAEVV